MSRKHRAKKIAQQRIDYLYELANRWLDEGRMTDSQNAIRHLRKLATSHLVSITEIKRSTCKSCNALLRPGVTCTVRIHRDRRVITCNGCSTIKRLGV